MFRKSENVSKNLKIFRNLRSGHHSDQMSQVSRIALQLSWRLWCPTNRHTDNVTYRAVRGQLKIIQKISRQDGKIPMEYRFSFLRDFLNSDTNNGWHSACNNVDFSKVVLMIGNTIATADDRKKGAKVTGWWSPPPGPSPMQMCAQNPTLPHFYHNLFNCKMCLMYFLGQETSHMKTSTSVATK